MPRVPTVPCATSITLSLWQMHVEILPAGVNKANALELLCARLLVPLSCVAAFGDGNNDAEMLTAAGFGVAVADARPLAKAAADVSSSLTNVDDVVARTCEQWISEGLAPWLADGCALALPPSAVCGP